MKNIRKIFKYQIWHLLSLIVIIIAIKLYIAGSPEMLTGTFRSIQTKIWFWLAIAIPVIHQVYVWLIWRIELYRGTLTKRFGIKRSFHYFAAGFSILFVSRLITIILLAFSSKNTLNIRPVFTYTLASLIIPLVVYLFYSVKKYFTVERAYGIDHFDKHYDEPYVKQGIFKYIDNGMYVFGLMILYLPGLFFLSEAAILAALFNHVYIWVHFFCTERPDMLEIYGDAP